MRWWRQSWLVQVIAIAILVWTAADLTNVSLCALDHEGTQSGPVTTSATRCDGAETQFPPAAPQHFDDCFCCSHCVELQVLVPETFEAPADLQRSPSVLASPRIFGSPLYHPPLA